MLLAFVTLLACDGATSPSPVITSIAPRKVLARDSAVTISLEGSGLDAGVKVEVGGIEVDPDWTNGRSLTFRVPPAVTVNVGTLDVVVLRGTVRSAPIQIEVIEAVRFVSVSGSARFGCALSVEGAAYCWADGFSQRMPDAQNIPAKVNTTVLFVALVSNQNRACGLTDAGDVYCWELGGSPSVVKSSAPPLASLSLGLGEICGVTNAGETWCWPGTPGFPPQQITSVPAFTTVSSGLHNCGLTADGSAYCWGDNRWGQLGTKGDTPGPVLVSSTIKFTQISAGMVHTCGRTASGTLYCWGDNQYGELGVEDLSPRDGPVQVSTSLHFESVLAGNLISCGFTAEKQAYCWGSNTHNILGTHSSISTQKPTQPIGYFKIISLSSGQGVSQALGDEASTCAVTDANKLYCWGFDVGVNPRRLDPAMKLY